VFGDAILICASKHPEHSQKGKKAMTELYWGLLGPEKLDSTRRTRTLGLATTVRRFNDLAVPGMGGVWFGKQLFLATLGVAVADCLQTCGKRIPKIATANAIEALACWLGLSENRWKSDPRLRGAVKMQNRKAADLVFSKMRQPGFYVTQPMRMATVQALPAIGMVASEWERFNSFSCKAHGQTLIDYACAPFRPHNSNVLACLTAWANGERNGVTTHALSKALNPMEAMAPAAREFLHERIVQKGGAQESRRGAALAWVERLRTVTPNAMQWEMRPAELDESHWNDLHAGALFFKVRDAAVVLLDLVEGLVARRGERQLALSAPLDPIIERQIATIRGLANDFLVKDCDPSPDRQASAFCRECLNPDDRKVLENIVKRDGRVLRLRDGLIVPGVAFRGIGTGPEDSQEGPHVDDAIEVKTIPLPEGISERVRNLFLLNADLHGDMMRWMNSAQSYDGGE
jgi:hypothetical protein